MAVRIGIIHASIKLGTKRSNTSRISRYVENLVNERPEVDVVVLPPYPITGPVIGYYPRDQLPTKIRELAERISQRELGKVSVNALARIASKHGKYIVAGPLLERAGPKVYITTVVIDPKGSIIGKYRKITLTSAERDAGISSGKDVEVLDIKGVKLGVFVDEDLATPEIFRMMQQRGVNIILGTMLPYISDVFSIESYEGVSTMKLSDIESFLVVRSKEVGVPLLLVGGFVEGNRMATPSQREPSYAERPYIAFTNTIPVDPDTGVIKDKVYGEKELNSYLVVEINSSTNKPRPLPEATIIFAKGFCRSARKGRPQGPYL